MSVDIAIVVPVYKHSVLVSDAIASALNQADARDYVVVVVNDGCPEAETRDTVDGWAALHPERIHVVHQANLGLSGARNAGVRFARSAYPDLKAVFFLDADNRLDPGAVHIFRRLLADTPDADWFFPNFDFFGLEAYAHNGAPYSVARMANSNQCEAGSLVRTRLFDAGIWFDESMRMGYEDWDFWLQASEKGFRGTRINQAVFRYRKRPESMLSGSHDRDTILRDRIAGRHRWLYARDGVLRATLSEGPYVLLCDLDSDQFRLLSGPDLAPEDIPFDRVAELLFAAHAQPQRIALPPFVLMARQPALDLMQRPRFATSVLCHLQSGLDEADLSLLKISQEGWDANYWFDRSVIDAEDWMPNGGAPSASSIVSGFRAATEDGTALMLKTQRLVDACDATRGGKLLAECVDGASISLTHAYLPDAVTDPGGTALKRGVSSFCDRLASAPYATRSRKRFKPWRKPAEITGPGDLPQILSKFAMNGAPLLFQRKAGPHIGFVLPILKFGGVEKCVVALATSLRAAGATCHLFVYGNENAASSEWLYEPFETVHMVGHGSLRDWSGPRYLGTNMADRPPEEIMRRILGPLTGMDVVINSGCAAMHHGLSALREKGIVTVAWEHLVETSAYGRSYGTPYLALAYEGAYDLILTCSQALSVWMHGHGVPQAKLLPIPNGPGFPMRGSAIDAALADRKARSPDDRLRIGFLGRMDAQKGLDRFLQIAEACRDLPLEFSITGKPVLDQDEAFEIPEGVRLDPPAYELGELEDAFARIDVLLMPSRDEGLPLTIMEAQRVGVVPIVSRVGAVEEAIRSGETGFLVDRDRVVPEMISLLRQLVADRRMYRRVSDVAARGFQQWDTNADTLLKALEGHLKTERLAG